MCERLVKVHVFVLCHVCRKRYYNYYQKKYFVVIFLGPVHRVVFIYELTSSEAVEKTVHSIIDDWNSLAQLYAAVLKFADIYNSKAASS